MGWHGKSEEKSPNCGVFGKNLRLTGLGKKTPRYSLFFIRHQ